MAKTDIPNLHRYKNQYGKWTSYYREAGRKKVRLRAEYLTAEFWDEYAAAKAGSRAAIGAGRARVGTFNATFPAYYTSVGFLGTVPSTQRTRRSILEHWRQQYGDGPVKDLQRKHIAAMIDAKAATPGAAGDLLKALRSLMRFCVLAGLREDDPTAGIKLPRRRTQGFYSWTEVDIAQYREHFPMGGLPRLALELVLNTGLRRSDAIRIGPQHLDRATATLRVVPRKTEKTVGKVLSIPVTPELAEGIEATPSGNLTFLVAERSGAPFTAEGFGSQFRRWCNEAGLPHCSAHGLRKAICRRLAEAGCTSAQIAAITGHSSLALVEHYTRDRDQELLARQAMQKISGT
jgi:integrase